MMAFESLWRVRYVVGDGDDDEDDVDDLDVPVTGRSSV